MRVDSKTLSDLLALLLFAMWRRQHKDAREATKFHSITAWSEAAVQAQGSECYVRFGSKADICSANSHVRFTPESGHVRCKEGCPLCANSGHSVSYSITSLARTRKLYGIVRPIALAVLRLTMISNLVARSIGRSPGLAPFIILSTNVAACRNMSGKSTP